MHRVSVAGPVAGPDRHLCHGSRAEIEQPITNPPVLIAPMLELWSCSHHEREGSDPRSGPESQRHHFLSGLRTSRFNIASRSQRYCSVSFEMAITRSIGVRFKAD
jgi:hypothetical protein